MLKYHVAVCDDEKSDLDGIVQSVQQYDVQGCFDIETYMDGNELLSELQMQKKSFDLLLLDIEYDGVTMSLETSDIYFLESHGHKVLIHCKEQDLTLRMSIPEALEQLPKRCFVSPHKSYLVNMEHIVYATGTAVFLSSGHQLPISRRKRQEFNQIFNAYLGR